MKVALALAYFGAKLTLPVQRVIRAEQLGFDAVFCPEIYGADAITPLAYLGALTKRIKLGTSLAIIAARTPAKGMATASPRRRMSRRHHRVDLFDEQSRQLQSRRIARQSLLMRQIRAASCWRCDSWPATAGRPTAMPAR